MRGAFTLKEAAAIAELPETAVRTAMERKVIAPCATTTGKSVRYAFGVKELFYVKLLSAFPFNLGHDDKRALRDLVLRRLAGAGRWGVEGTTFILRSEGLVLRVEARQLRTLLARNLAAYRRGLRRIRSNPDILSGEPVFDGTRIPLAHIAGLVARGVDPAEILDDYPALSRRDLAFAAICARMKPEPGRPRKAIELRRGKSSPLAA
jgi:uncharacterized protein (DUF433 family)